MPKIIMRGLVGTLAVASLLSVVVYGEVLPEKAKSEPQVDLLPVELEEQPVELQAIPPQQPEGESQGAKVAPIVATPAIVTTRPSFTDSWLVVPQGSFQMESGVTYTDNRGGTRSWNLPESLLKLGLGKNTEFRFGVPNYLYFGGDNTVEIANSLGDIAVGFSHHQSFPKHNISVALIPFVNVPIGNNDISGNGLDPQVRLVVAKNFTPKWIVASQFDTRWNSGKNNTTKVIMHPTLISYYSFTRKITGFLEYGGFYPTKGHNQQFVQGGLLYLPTPRQQWDVRIATGFNQYSPDILVGFGYSFRVDGLFGASRAFSSFKK